MSESNFLVAGRATAKRKCSLWLVHVLLSTWETLKIITVLFVELYLVQIVMLAKFHLLLWQMAWQCHTSVVN